MSTLNAIQFIPTTQKANTPINYKGVDDTTTAAQFALLKAGQVGTDGILAGVSARFGDYGVVLATDGAGNYKLRRYSDLTGNIADAYKVDSTYGLLDHFGSPGGYKSVVVEDNLGAPADETVGGVHAAITMPGTASATGIHAAITLTTATQTITTGITDPAGLIPTIVGNDTDMVGPVIFAYTDLAGTARTLTLQLNGTTTVVPTLDMIPYGVDTIQSITVAPYTVDSSETVSVGTKGLVVISGFTQPDFPRAFSITGSASGINTVQSWLGTDVEGTTILDSATANGTATVAGTKAMKTVISVAIAPKTNSSGDTISLDTTDILGLNHRMDTDAVFWTNFGNTREATRPTVTFDGTNISGNTVLLNSDLDGSKTVVVCYMRSDAPLEFDRL